MGITIIFLAGEMTVAEGVEAMAAAEETAGSLYL
jgi:hypothetical protein